MIIVLFGKPLIQSETSGECVGVSRVIGKFNILHGKSNIFVSRLFLGGKHYSGVPPGRA